MIDRREVLTSAWALYRMQRLPTFDRARFAEYLRRAWANAKRYAEIDAANAERAAANPKRAEMSARIEALSYLPFHMNAARRAAEIRAEYARAA